MYKIQVIIINNVKISADDTTENLTKNITTDHRLIARIDGAREEVLKMIKGISGVISVTADMEREKGVYDYEIETKEDVDIRRELFKRVAARNWIILGLKTSEMTLEDIFLKITMDDSFELKMKKSSEEKAAATDAEAEEQVEKTEEADAEGDDSVKSEEADAKADDGKKEEKAEKKSKKEKSKEAEE
ncbi:MAG: hypothetical protein K2K34_06535 [Oscillospiraceae bacterium]|nr:hypothetical protein [Oscillospiraceae bacterium]